MSVERWSLPGFDGQPIHGNTEEPKGDPAFTLILAHGFTAHLGFGFLPVLSRLLVAQHHASVARFTFSHAGVTGGDGIRVDRPDLFQRDTWGKQVFDLGVVFDSVRGEAPSGTPVIIAGHSRGGGVSLLLAGRRFRDGATLTPDGVIAIQAPDRPGSLSDDDCRRLVRDGSMTMTAPLTGQELTIGAEFGQERLDHPADFDVLSLCESIACPVLAVGGERDKLVPPVCAKRIARACPRGEAVILDGADHMFNTPEPADLGAPVASSVAALADAIGTFALRLGA